ncbi:hypothetical protein [Echinicola rosea]|uniref:hypothetical protein n=1 Tax=Echinicola rosea TaxID=1807691 RepID=UPI0010CA93F2|nr:hypothetical protein [Echinicola rosea]
MPVFQPMVEAVKKGSWLASWNSETHLLLGRSHRMEIKMGDGSTSHEKSMSHFKGQTTGLDFFNKNPEMLWTKQHFWGMKNFCMYF